MAESGSKLVMSVHASDHGRKPRVTSIRLLAVFMTLGMLLLVVWDLSTEGELLARGPAQFFLEPQPVELKDMRFPSRNASAAASHRVEVLSNDTELQSGSVCVAGIVDPTRATYHSDHRFYTLLRELGPLPPPVFRGKHAELCDAAKRADRMYSYCLPISGRKDEPFCSAPDRLDLLTRQSPDTLCYGSVLHMLLADVVDELKVLGAEPLVAFGTLLGAVRNGSVIPFTEDVDVAHLKLSSTKTNKLRQALWAKGYHVFFHNIWRVCVAPTHPLASNLYDPDHGLVGTFGAPYVDLYTMKREANGQWNMQETKNGRRLPDNKVRPHSTVHINGLSFDTVHDPIDFLRKEYGDGFMTPKPR